MNKNNGLTIVTKFPWPWTTESINAKLTSLSLVRTSSMPKNNQNPTFKKKHKYHKSRKKLQHLHLSFQMPFSPH
jgi:hypothetical protein